MNNKTFTLVYVFGPKRCKEKYENDQILDRQIGEWVKIGETSIDKSLEEITPELMLNAACARCSQESHTGIAELSCIYDVFIFPYKLKTDDKIRKLLCNDIYTLENTFNANRNLAEGEIAPGKEFVYGVCRNNIKHAVESFDHKLIVDAEDEDIKMIRTLCRINDISIENGAEDDAEDQELRPVGASRQGGKRRMLDTLLEKGDIVTLTSDGHTIVTDDEGEPITAIYSGNNKFECRGELKTSSYLAKQYINLYAYDRNGQKREVNTINGNAYWTIEGKRLIDLDEDASEPESTDVAQQ